MAQGPNKVTIQHVLLELIGKSCHCFVNDIAASFICCDEHLDHLRPDYSEHTKSSSQRSVHSAKNPCDRPHGSGARNISYKFKGCISFGSYGHFDAQVHRVVPGDVGIVMDLHQLHVMTNSAPVWRAA